MPVILHNTGGVGGLFKKLSEFAYRLKTAASAVSITSEQYPSLPAVSIQPTDSDWKINGKPAKYLQDYIASFTVTGTYASSIVEPYYLTTNKEAGILCIGLCTNTTAYENVYVRDVVDNTGMGIAKIAETHVNQTAGAAGDYSASFFNAVTKPVHITVEANSRNATYDYIVCTVTFNPVE